MKLAGIYGAGGCGRGVMPIARKELAARKDCKLVFVDDGSAGQSINGHEVMSFADFVAAEAAEKAVALAVADSRVRKKLAGECAAKGIGFMSLWAASAIRMDDVEIGEGALVSPYVTFTSNIRIGRHFQANLYSYVEHDCVIGNYVTFAPRVSCNGNIHIGDHVYVGTGAMIRQGRSGAPLRIGENAVIGMGAVVTNDVPPGVTVVGVPARPLERRPRLRNRP